MEYSLLHARAASANVDDALQAIAADWSGEVIAPQAHLGEIHSTVLMTERAAAKIAPLLSEFLNTKVLVATVAGERFSISCWQPDSPAIRADGSDNSAATEVASALGKDANRLQQILQSSVPAADRHAEAAELLMLPLPLLTGHQPMYDTGPTIQLSEIPEARSRFRNRRRLRIIYNVLGVLEFLAFLAIDYFWFLEPNRLLIPTIIFFIVNGVVLLLLRRKLRTPPKGASSSPE